MIAGPNGQVVYLVVLSTALCATVIACDRVDLAGEAMGRARAITTDVEERLIETKAELTDKAKEINKTIRRDIGMAARKYRDGHSIIRPRGKKS
jgi:hypothetical protein